jgi:dihydropyrimidinase
MSDGTFPFDLVIRGGTVVLPDTTADVDIGVRDGRIVAIEADLPAGRQEVSRRAAS